MSASVKSGRILLVVICGGILIAASWVWARSLRRNDFANLVAAGQKADDVAKEESVEAQQRQAATRIEWDRQLETLPQPFSRQLLSMSHHEPQLGTDGVRHPLDATTGVTVPDGMYIYDLVRRTKPARTSEVGLAEGFSTVYFLAALQSNGNGLHVAMDPYESDWHGVGLQEVKNVGMEKRFRFLPEKSIAALPQLANEHQSYEVIFIDGDHRFDGAFTDFVLSDPICPKGGYLLFHDPWMPATKKVISFIEHNRPDYARRPVPHDVNIAVFQKVGDDQRSWMNFTDF